jgi:hypothetical protein
MSGTAIVETYENEDGSVSLMLIVGDHALDIEISADSAFVLRYEIGKGSEYKIVYDSKEVKSKELISEIKNLIENK